MTFKSPPTKEEILAEKVRLYARLKEVGKEQKFIQDSIRYIQDCCDHSERRGHVCPTCGHDND